MIDVAQETPLSLLSGNRCYNANVFKIKSSKKNNSNSEGLLNIPTQNLMTALNE